MKPPRPTWPSLRRKPAPSTTSRTAPRNYGFTHNASTSFAGQDVLTDATAATVDEKTPNQVNLTLETNAADGLLLGYEIARITTRTARHTPRWWASPPTATTPTR